jgi:hypothetical protein
LEQGDSTEDMPDLEERQIVKSDEKTLLSSNEAI